MNFLTCFDSIIHIYCTKVTQIIMATFQHQNPIKESEANRAIILHVRLSFGPCVSINKIISFKFADNSTKFLLGLLLFLRIPPLRSLLLLCGSLLRRGSILLALRLGAGPRLHLSLSGLLIWLPADHLGVDYIGFFGCPTTE